MNKLMQLGVILLVAAAISGVAWGIVNSAKKQKMIDITTAQVRGIGEDLDSMTEDTGVYIKQEVNEFDAWGKDIKVVYSQGGVTECLVVRSAGPDQMYNSDDDIVVAFRSANLKGVGIGIKKNIEETSQNGARGAVTGAIEALEGKEGFLKSFFGKKTTEVAKASD